MAARAKNREKKMKKTLKVADWAKFDVTKITEAPFLAHLSSAQDELLWSLFARRPSVNIFKDFFSETAEPILLKFHMEPP